jgi:glucose-6-phosphate isomerase, archaeal
MDYMPPFTKFIDFRTGIIPEAVVVQQRHLSDMRGLYANAEAEAALAETNPLIYEVHEATTNPEIDGQLRYSTTIIYPGKVGDEFFMTKGHYHAKGETAELYVGLAGVGYLILQTPEGVVSLQKMTPGAAAYVPPFWGHRTINIGRENFVFMACYPADAGYNYGAIAETGFAQLVVERDGQVTAVPNPKFRK